MPSLIILVITRIQSHGHVPRDWILFCSLVQSNMASMTSESNQIHTTTCYDEYKILSCDHAWKITICNFIEIWPTHVIFILAIIKQAITISSVQDACLEHVVVLVTSKLLQENIFPPFSYFQNIQITHTAKTVPKSCLEKFEIKTKINLMENKE